MIISYYTDKDGKIVNSHSCHEHTLQEIESMAETYNRSTDKRKAHVIEVADDSLTAYLLWALERKKIEYESLREAIIDIENALDAVSGLL